MLVRDRVKETTTVTGTGNATPTGAVSSFVTFAGAGIATPQRFPYLIQGVTVATEWETGIGYLDGSGDIVRALVRASSNSNNLVNFSAGTKHIGIALIANATLLVPQALGLRGFRRI